MTLFQLYSYLFIANKLKVHLFLILYSIIGMFYIPIYYPYSIYLLNEVKGEFTCKSNILAFSQHSIANY